MNNLLANAALVAAILAPTAAQAQAVPPAIIAVVDLDKVTSNCNACKTAAATLRSQVTGLQNREKSLATPLQTEGKTLQAAVDALNGKEPDAALQARIKAFQTRQQQGAQELSSQQSQIQRNQAYIQKQILDKLGPIYSQVMTKRGANIMVEVGSTLATSQSVDVTNDVLAALNAALPTLNTTAPAAAQPANPQGR
jgi:Skp family chaperone for outer membrane proteins